MNRIVAFIAINLYAAGALFGAQAGAGAMSFSKAGTAAASAARCVIYWCKNNSGIDASRVRFSYSKSANIHDNWNTITDIPKDESFPVLAQKSRNLLTTVFIGDCATSILATDHESLAAQKMYLSLEILGEPLPGFPPTIHCYKRSADKR